MSEPDAETLFTNPSRLFADGALAKHGHRRRLAEILTGQRERPEVDELARQVAATVAPMVEAAIDAALTSAADEPSAQPTARASFDGGARATVPFAPPTHDEWLTEVIRRRLADRGADF